MRKQPCTSVSKEMNQHTSSSVVAGQAALLTVVKGSQRLLEMRPLELHAFVAHQRHGRQLFVFLAILVLLKAHPLVEADGIVER